MEELLLRLTTDVQSCATIESLVCGKGFPKQSKIVRARKAPVRGNRNTDRSSTSHSEATDVFSPHKAVQAVVERCRVTRKRRASDDTVAVDHETLSKFARFTDGFNLKSFEQFLHYVPRLVNVVTLAEAVPIPETGLKLPLDLNFIASRCTGAYFAPRRFAAVQLAYTHPRARVLVFHTGRLVGTGTSGPMAARLAISRAQRQLSQDAGIHLHIRSFNVINQVGACSLRATLNCEEFANAHPFDSHFDRQSFVGLAWRPAGEDICCEVYSTGRANLPGSVRERQLHESWSRMLPELLRYSSRSRILTMIPDHLRNAHHSQVLGAPSSSADAGSAPRSDMMDGWTTAAPAAISQVNDDEGDQDEAVDEYGVDDAFLSQLGL